MAWTSLPRAGDLFVRRIFLCSAFVVAFTAIVFAKLYQLQVLRSGDYRSSAHNNCTKLVPIHPPRGRIYDRNGIPLAMNRASYTLESQGDVEESRVSNLLSELETTLGMQTGSLVQADVWPRRSANGGQLRLVVDLNDVQRDRLLVGGCRHLRLELRKTEHRFYPYGPLLSHAVGYVSKIDDLDVARLKSQGGMRNYSLTERIGKSGVECHYESVLRGKIGCRRLQIDSSGDVFRCTDVRSASSGKDISLTLDLNLQTYVRSLVTRSRAAVVVLDPRDGSVRALVSSPDYDPNLFARGISKDRYLSMLEGDGHALVNRVVQGIYPPASTAKPYISISALIAGVVDRHATLVDPGWWRLPGSGRIYRGWKRDGHGRLDLIRALEESSDAFFYQLAYGMGIDLLSEWMARFGYGMRTGVDLPGEHPGLLPTREWKSSHLKESWYPGDTVSVGIGQGYWVVTPMQMSKALLMLINDGRQMVPHLLRRGVSAGELAPPADDLRSDCWSIVKRGMYGVVHGANGTASRSFFGVPYKVAAKSGTAQVCGLRAARGVDFPRNEALKDHKMMIAFAPFDKPTAAVVVVLENGGADHPVGVITRKILDYAILANRLTRSQILNLSCGRE